MKTLKILFYLITNTVIQDLKSIKIACLYWYWSIKHILYILFALSFHCFSREKCRLDADFQTSWAWQSSSILKNCLIICCRLYRNCCFVLRYSLLIWNRKVLSVKKYDKCKLWIDLMSIRSLAAWLILCHGLPLEWAKSSRPK